jgi:hypothetical protein
MKRHMLIAFLFLAGVLAAVALIAHSRPAPCAPRSDSCTVGCP